MSAVTRFGKWRIKPSSKLPIFIRYVINSSFDRKIAKAAGFKNFVVNRVFLNHMMYWPVKEYDAFEAEVIGHLKSNDGWYENYYRKELRNAEYLYKWGLRLQKVNWLKKTNSQIEKVLTELLNYYRMVIGSWYVQYPSDTFFEDAIETELAKIISVNHPDFRKIVLIFTDPKGMTDVAEERWRLIKLAQKFKTKRERLPNLSSAARKDIKQHLQKFAYISRGLATSKPYEERDIVKRIAEVGQAKEGLSELLRYSSPKKIDDDFKWAIKLVKPGKKFRHLIDQARSHSYLRNRRVEAFILADYGASFMYREIARRSKFNPDWIMDVSVPEMYAALQGQPLPSVAEMKRRFHNYAMVVRNAQTSLINEPKKIKKLEKLYSVVHNKAPTVQGRVACVGGIIKGRAKVCLDKKEIGKVKRGDILVAQFTTPDFVPAMERAAAIVADQGGLSSHAAIVSRELGVPCVIATEKGTRLIHDNDLLEVNAKTGLVTILKRA